MMTPHRPLFGAGAHTLTHLPIDRLGRATLVASPTYSIVDMTEGDTASERIVVPSTAATVDGVSTVLAGIAGRGQSDATVIAVSSSTGVISGRRYVVSTAADSGERELVTALRMETGAVYATRELRGTYPGSSLFQGVEVSGTFPAFVADDEDLAIRDGREYQVIWSYAIDGVEYLVPERIIVGRYSVSIPWIDTSELLRGDDRLARMVSTRLVQEVLSVATDEISGELEASRVDPAYYRPTIAGRTALRYLALHKLYMNLGQDSDVETAKEWRIRYKHQILQMIEGRPNGARLVSRHDDTVHGQRGAMDILVPA